MIDGIVVDTTPLLDDYKDWRFITTPYANNRELFKFPVSPKSILENYDMVTGELVNNQPIDIPSREVSGSLIGFYKEDYYNRYHIVPQTIGLGRVFAPQTRQFTIWSAYLEQHTITDIIETDIDGMVLNKPLDYETFIPLEKKLFSIDVPLEGLVVIDARFDFIFDNDSTHITVTGERGGYVWSYPPMEDIVEVMEWSTAISQTYGQEARYALRAYPRVEVKYTHYFDPYKYSTAKNLCASSIGETFVVPLWFYQEFKESIPINESTFEVDTSIYTYSIEQYIMIWGGVEDYILARIIEIGDGYITVAAPTVRAMGRCYIMPCEYCLTTSGLVVQRTDNRLAKSDISFYTTNSIQKPHNDYPLLNDLPVYTTPFYEVGGNDETITQAHQIVDYNVGDVLFYNMEEVTREAFTISLAMDNIKNVQDVKNFLSFVEGRFGAFWLPSNNKDMYLTRNILSSDDSFLVKDMGFVLRKSTLNAVSILLKDGTTLSYRVLDVSTEINAVESITIDGTFEQNISMDSIYKIQVTSLVRLNSDRVEINYKNYDKVTIKIPVISLNDNELI